MRIKVRGQYKHVVMIDDNCNFDKISNLTMGDNVLVWSNYKRWTKFGKVIQFEDNQELVKVSVDLMPEPTKELWFNREKVYKLICVCA